MANSCIGRQRWSNRTVTRSPGHDQSRSSRRSSRPTVLAADRLVDRCSDTGPIDVLAVSKDKKELLVLELRRGRASDAVVGNHELGIAIKTVETHVSAVLRKLQLSNRYELSRWAADRRLV